MKKSSVIAAALMIVMFSGLGGCSMQKKMDENHAEVERVSSQVRHEAATFDTRIDRVQPGLYLGAEMIKPSDEQAILPAAFDKEVIYANARPVNFEEFATDLLQIAGVRAILTADAAAFLFGEEEDQGEDAANVATSVSGVENQGGSAESDMFDVENGIDVNYAGDVKGLLDQVAANLSLWWRWNQSMKQVEFYRFNTETFVLNAFPGELNVRYASASSEQGTASAENDSSIRTSQVSSMEIQGLSVWKNLIKGLEGMSSDGGRVSPSEATGQIVVMDTPPVLERMSALVDATNRMLSKQIFFDIKVFEVSASDGQNLGIDWNINWQSLPVAATLNQGYFVLDPNIPTATVSAVGTKFDGSQLLLQMLREKNNVNLVTTASGTTLNTQPISVGNTTGEGYIEQVQVNSTAQSSTVSAQQSKINYGFSVTVMPRILSHKDVLMQIQISLSRLDQLRRERLGSEGELVLEMPKRSSRDIMQRVQLSDGQTLVISGFEFDRSSRNFRGVGPEVTMPLGGHNASEGQRQSLLIMITPHIVNI